MRKFDLISPAAAMQRLNAAMDAARACTQTEEIDALAAAGRVIAQDVISPTAMPEFVRGTMDGFAVRAADGANPRRIIGEVRMGSASALNIGPGDAARIHTGGKLPPGADSVVPVELCEVQLADGVERLMCRQPPTVGENTIAIGEDVTAGETVIRAGSVLRSAEIGGLAALGVMRIRAWRQPRVAIIASGDEVVPPHVAPRDAQVRDINTYTLSTVVRRNGGLPVSYGIVRDDPAEFMAVARRALAECDVLVFMAGSSVSERDFTPDVIARLGAPGVLQHGIQFRPGKPTLFALCDGKPVFGLPGNPVSALVTGTLFVGPTLWRMQRAASVPQPNMVRAKLAEMVHSPKNLEHWLAVHVGDGTATPILSKSNLIFSLVRANGLICVPVGVDEIVAGAEVDVMRLE